MISPIHCTSVRQKVGTFTHSSLIWGFETCRPNVNSIKFGIRNSELVKLYPAYQFQSVIKICNTYVMVTRVVEFSTGGRGYKIRKSIFYVKNHLNLSHFLSSPSACQTSRASKNRDLCCCFHKTKTLQLFCPFRFNFVSPAWKLHNPYYHNL